MAKFEFFNISHTLYDVPDPTLQIPIARLTNSIFRILDKSYLISGASQRKKKLKKIFNGVQLRTSHKKGSKDPRKGPRIQERIQGFRKGSKDPKKDPRIQERIQGSKEGSKDTQHHNQPT
ncbi:hypothetical protein PV328_010322 [Microctonus aethiopoides]|uniref:Uncharacterized protein n=1 Tax=Microctonus aethiopoides TaxID=144406 RepID=A0AA39C7P0_9HYME|nr:hypothetical protein PV328_010322 [Microctonus aethiopoides]